MGGPAMIEGGGLGVVAPDDVGPDVGPGAATGSWTSLVPDDAAAVAAARRYLAPARRPAPVPAERGRPAACCATCIPENRVRSYDVRPVVETLCRHRQRAGAAGRVRRRDRHRAGPARRARRSGCWPTTRGTSAGRSTRDAADKAAAFLRLCEAHRLPVVSLVDTPGFMVGPEAERTATVRRFGAMFVAGARLHRAALRGGAAQGLRPGRDGDGRRATCAARPHRGLADRRVRRHGPGGRGPARLPQGARRDRRPRGPRRPRYERAGRRAYERGKALSTATAFEIDDVIDPADTRRVLAAGRWRQPVPTGVAEPDLSSTSHSPASRASVATNRSPRTRGGRRTRWGGSGHR